MKKDLDSIISENINACVESIIKEASINAKKRNNNNVKNALTKGRHGYNAIKSFAILTAQNSDSQQQSAKDNKTANHSLLDDLKRGNYIVIPTQGKFEQLENSYCVINISLNAVKHYSGRYQQTSFIYTTIDDDMSIKNHYFEKADITKPYKKSTNDYVCKDSTSECKDMSDANDYYTKLGGFKFSIPFSIFESINEKIINNLIGMQINESKEGQEMHWNRLLNWSTKRVGQSPHLYRKRLYKGII